MGIMGKSPWEGGLCVKACVVLVPERQAKHVFPVLTGVGLMAGEKMGSDEEQDLDDLLTMLEGGSEVSCC